MHLSSGLILPDNSGLRIRTRGAAEPPSPADGSTQNGVLLPLEIVEPTGIADAASKLYNPPGSKSSVRNSTEEALRWRDASGAEMGNSAEPRAVHRLVENRTEEERNNRSSESRDCRRIPARS